MTNFRSHLNHFWLSKISPWRGSNIEADKSINAWFCTYGFKKEAQDTFLKTKPFFSSNEANIFRKDHAFETSNGKNEKPHFEKKTISRSKISAFFEFWPLFWFESHLEISKIDWKYILYHFTMDYQLKKISRATRLTSQKTAIQSVLFVYL